jgi:CRP/FNR family transcriptional regulator
MNTSTDKEVIEAFPFLKTIPPAATSQFLTIGYRQHLKASMQIYWEGDTCHGIAFILSGDIRVYKTGVTGREITLYEIGPGETSQIHFMD